MQKISKEEFEKRYCKESDLTLEEYHNNFVTLPCSCEYEYCEGWACVENNPLIIKLHKRANGIGD
ncbi:hypothetical protein [Clostridium paraputrificum]|uniref:hypothetical protein n=1 Tax=Clostridium paraputrificum TaxID=29363 RepID=UPI00189E0B20|nr:hypothetical protein [Clostridium paraputrificum]